MSRGAGQGWPASTVLWFGIVKHKRENVLKQRHCYKWKTRENLRVTEVPQETNILRMWCLENTLTLGQQHLMHDSKNDT